MSSIHRLAAGVLFAACAFFASLSASAQAIVDCPALPATAGLQWDRMDGQGYTFCKAQRADGSEAFAVMLTTKSPFKPNRADRAEAATINDHPTWWYRSEIANAPGTLVREALVELGNGKIAYISLRAADQAQLEETAGQVANLRFTGSLLTSN